MSKLKDTRKAKGKCVSKTFSANREKVEGILAYLEEKFDVFVLNYEDSARVVYLKIEWDKTEKNK